MFCVETMLVAILLILEAPESGCPDTFMVFLGFYSLLPVQYLQLSQGHIVSHTTSQLLSVFAESRKTPIIMVIIIFIIWKLMCVLYVFIHAEFKYISRTAISPTGFVRQNSLICNYNECGYFLSCCQDVLDMVEALHYMLNVVWICKLNHDKDSRHVSPIKDSQAVRAQTCTDTFG